MTSDAGPLILTAAQMRAAEEAAMAQGTSVDVLMERAGTAVADAVWRFGGGRPVLILCGPGNNGGDGYVAARVLRDRGIIVRVAASGPPRTDVAMRARAVWNGPVEPLDDQTDASPTLVDALFGTGLARALDPALGTRLTRLGARAQLRLAVDVPSGVDSDSGALLGGVATDLTLALGCLKPAHYLQPARALCGRIRIADIGIDTADFRAGATRGLVRPQLPAPDFDDHKYRRGLVLVVAGDMPGAALLAASAAQRSGAGYVMLGSDEPVSGGTMALVRRGIAAALSDTRLSALIVGPGLGQSPAARHVLMRSMAMAQPLVVDADGLAMVTPEQISARDAGTILTPHDGEFDRLFGKVSGSKIDRARAAAHRSGAVVIYKGADTVVAAPDGRVAINPAASAWLASAGTGDVLAGICGAMLGLGLDPFTAATAAVWLHSEAARQAGPALIADDLIARLSKALAACL